MAYSKRHSAFSELYRNRNELYIMYSNALNVFNQSRHLSQLAKMSFELTGHTFDFNKIDDLNKAISELTKFRKKQIIHLNRCLMDCRDFRLEYNYIVGTLNALRAIELVRANIDSNSNEEGLKDIIEYENDDSNPDIRSTRALRLAEVDLIKKLHLIYSDRFKCEALCKISKSIISRLHRHRSTLAA